MIIGIGADITVVERIKKAAEKQNFAQKCFSDDERQFLNAITNPNKLISSMAAGFAAKEAFAKAMGVGFRGFFPNNIEVLREKNGKPYIRLNGNALKLAEERGVKNINVSLSHDGGFAVAFVVLE